MQRFRTRKAKKCPPLVATPEVVPFEISGPESYVRCLRGQGDLLVTGAQGTVQLHSAQPIIRVAQIVIPRRHAGPAIAWQRRVVPILAGRCSLLGRIIGFGHGWIDPWASRA